MVGQGLSRVTIFGSGSGSGSGLVWSGLVWSGLGDVRTYGRTTCESSALLHPSAWVSRGVVEQLERGKVWNFKKRLGLGVASVMRHETSLGWNAIGLSQGGHIFVVHFMQWDTASAAP